MPANPLHILAAQIGLTGYAPGFLTDPLRTINATLPGMGRVLRSIVMGTDPKIGPVPYGFFSTGGWAPEICTLRGTQMPDGSMVEWMDDFDAVLEQCPWAPPGCQWHRGFGRVYSTLNVEGVPLAQVLANNPGTVIEGHSLAGTLATYAAAESRSAAPVLFASPKFGNSALRDYCLKLWGCTTASYANPNDAVPKVPITVDWPLKLEDFQQVAPLIELPAASVTPPIASSWAESHSLSNYVRLLQAIP